MDRFKGKIAIVTGAASGIGEALAKELCRRGAFVIFVDQNKEAVQHVCELELADGGKGNAIALDVTDNEAIKKMVENVVLEHGQIDYLFNNAGIAIAGEFRDVSLEDWHHLFNVNLFGVINGMKAAYPINIRAQRTRLWIAPFKGAL